MKILVVEPVKHPYTKEIEGTLKQMQQIVGGPIQAIYPFSDEVGIVCNDEALLQQLPFNRQIAEECYLVGTFFICGLGKENFDPLQDGLLTKNTAPSFISLRFTQKGASLTSCRSSTVC